MCCREVVMAVRAKHRRRTYLLREGSQLRLIIAIQIIFLVLLVVGGVLFYLVTKRDLGETYWSAHITVKNVSEILLPTLIAMNAVGVALSITASIFFTHRIAGPAFSLCRTLREIGRGNLDQRVAFRKNDEMKELAQAANEMLENLNHRLLTLQTEGEAIRDESERLINMVSGQDPPCPAMQVARAVAEGGQEQESALARFKAQLERTGEVCPVAKQAQSLADRTASLQKGVASFRLNREGWSRPQAPEGRESQPWEGTSAS
jgi:HAMP domain-containing protein